MKAILTKFLPCTDFRESRVKADDTDGNSIILSWKHELNADENHRMAAEALKNKMNWKGNLIMGSCREFSVFVFEPKGE